MKKIGLIGGMSWESSLEYYRLINEGYRDHLGGWHSAYCVMVSVDFAQIEALQEAGAWDEMGNLLAGEAQALERAGAGCVVLCTNTMHKVASVIEQSVSIPLIHIADAAAQQVRKAGLTRVGLLGTRFTMEQDFYRQRLKDNFGLDVLVPAAEDRVEIHRVIYDELVLGKIEPQSRLRFQQIIARLVERGVQGIILGCTEIGLLVKAGDSPVELFDTTKLHAAAAVEWALAQD